MRAKAEPLVSAVIATYNRGSVVGEAIESILSQTYQNVEVIVVDDGSTDDTHEKLKRYSERIRVVWQTNAGPAAAWNRGIIASNGEVIAFLGSDDLWLPTFVERQVSLLQRLGEGVPCCVANCCCRFATGRVTTSFDEARLRTDVEEGKWLNVAEVLVTRFVVFGQAVAVRRAALERAGGFDERLRFLEDYDLALRLSVQGPWGFIREPLVVWRQGADSLSREALRDWAHLYELAIEVRERALCELWDGEESAGVRALLTRGLKGVRRMLQARRMRERNNRIAAGLGSMLLLAERVRAGLFRRSSSYPQMVVAGLESSLCVDSSSDQTEDGGTCQRL